jgi:hypothetical protein
LGDNSGVRVTVNGVRLYFDVEGRGLAAWDREMVARPTLVLLHGGPGADHSLFKPEFSAMADAAQVVYLDLRGSGRSDHGDPDLWTWDQWADDVAGFCQALGIEAPVLGARPAAGGWPWDAPCATLVCPADWSWTARCSARIPGGQPGGLRAARRRGGPGSGGTDLRRRHQPGGGQGMGRSRAAAVRKRVRR